MVVPISESRLAEELRETGLLKKPVTAADLGELRWETRQRTLMALLSEVEYMLNAMNIEWTEWKGEITILLTKQIPGSETHETLEKLVKKRKEHRRSEREREKSGSVEEIGFLPEEARKAEDLFRARFCDLVAKECEKQGAPRNSFSGRLLLQDRGQCLQAIEFLLARHRSRMKAHVSYLQRLSQQQQQQEQAQKSPAHHKSPIPRLAATTRQRPSSSMSGHRPPWVSLLGGVEDDDSSQCAPDLGCSMSSIASVATSALNVADSSGVRLQRQSLSGSCRDQGTHTASLNEEEEEEEEEDEGERTEEGIAAAPTMTRSVQRRGRHHEAYSRGSSSIEVVSGGYKSNSGAPSVRRPRDDSARAGMDDEAEAESEVDALRAENVALKARLALMEAALSSRPKSDAAGPHGPEQRRVLDMMQMQNLQLQRQVRVLEVAMDGARALSEHVSALLSTLEANVEEVLRVVPSSRKPQAAAAAAAGEEIKKPQGCETTAVVSSAAAEATIKGTVWSSSSSSSSLVGIGPNFWSGVLRDVSALRQRWIQVQRDCRAAKMKHPLMPPPEACPFIRKPSQMTHAVALEDHEAAAGAGAAGAGSRSKWKQQQQQQDRTAGESALVMPTAMEAARLHRLAADLAGLVRSLEALCDELLKDPAFTLSMRKRNGHEAGLAAALDAVLDVSKALMLDVAAIGVVLPVADSVAVPWSREKELCEQFSSLTQRGLKSSEVASKARALEHMVMAERRAVGRALVMAMEEVMAWRRNKKNN